MANHYHGGGSQSPNSISKPLERVFEDAQHTGEIQLNCRKLREYPKQSAKYDLVDTISADVSKNRLAEVPKELCTYISMEKLNCYHNVVKSIPEAIVQLQALTYLNLSRNQLSIIPSFISQLQTLEVLIASHNKLVSLPEEIGVLDKLMELDVSCNEISHLPMQIGDLKSLKSLNVRRNLLQELPVEISKLNLRKLDISSNRVSKLPTVYRKIETLEDIILNNNPLTLPPAHVCTKGRQHIMKYLHITAIREDKARMGMLGEIDMKRFRKSLPPAQSGSSEEFRTLMDTPDKWKRHTVLSSDSGYSTTDSVDKCGWSPQENGMIEPPHLVESNNLAMRAAAAVCREAPRYPGPPAREPPPPPTREPARRTSTELREPRRTPPAPPQRLNSRLSLETDSTLSQNSVTSPVTPVTPITPPKPLLKPAFSTQSSSSSSSLYSSAQTTPLSPPNPQGPGPGLVSPTAPGHSILGTSLEDEFTRELQRQKQEYEHKKKIAEQLRIQQEEEDEQRRRAAHRLQAEDAKRLEEEQQRLAAEESARRLAAEQESARKAEETRRVEEARRVAEEQTRLQEGARKQEELKHRNDNNFYFKSNASHYNNNSSTNQAWPPPPSPLANQHESHTLYTNQHEARSPMTNQHEARSPMTNQHEARSPAANQYPARSPGTNQHGSRTPVTPDQQAGYRSPYSHSGQSPVSPGFQNQNTSQYSPGGNSITHTNTNQFRPIGNQSPSPSVRSYGRQQQPSPNTSNYSLSPGFHEGARHSPGAHGAATSPSPFGPGYVANQQQRPASGQQQRHASAYSHLSSACDSSVHNTDVYQQQNPPVSNYDYQTSVHNASEPNYQHVNNRPASNTIQQSPPHPGDTQQQGYYSNQHSNQQNYHQGNPHSHYGNDLDYRAYQQGQGQISPHNSMSHDPYTDYRKPTVVSQSSNKEPVSSQHRTISNGRGGEGVVGVNGAPPSNQSSTSSSPSSSLPSQPSTPPHAKPGAKQPSTTTLSNGPVIDSAGDRPRGTQATSTVGGVRRPKNTERPGPVTTLRTATKPGDKPGTSTTGRATGVNSVASRSGLPTSRRTNLNQDEELRKSNSSLKSSDGSKPKSDQRLRSIQKDAVNNFNRRSSGSTSSEDDRKRSTPTRSTALHNSTSSSTGAPTVSKRSGTVMTSAHVKMLDDYSKEANGGTNYTLRRHNDHHRDSIEQMDQLRKTISMRLKRSLPDNLSEALSDGVLLCHLANQIRPRSVASVHVPSPAVPKLTPPKCRKNVENFLEACRKIGVSKDQICESSDILSEKGLNRVAYTVASLVAIATHSKHPVPSNV